MKEQEQKGTVYSKYTVCVRIRPKLNQDQQTVFTPVEGNKVKQQKSKSIITYCFDNVYEQDNDNQYIFKDSISKKVELFLNKKVNTTILAYGQTGSGKTHTLFGSFNKSQLGITHFISQQIISYCVQKNIQAKCTFLQIYKQKVTDLLNGNVVSLRDNKDGLLILDNNQVKTVKTKNQIMELFKIANSNKIFGQSYVHSESSRSHVLFSITIQKATLNIVDLCGSEVLTYQFDAKQRQQTNAINLSLFTLNAVVSDLCSKGQKFIPFRNSVLTRLLKSSLVDDKKTQIYLFCNISPQRQHQQFSSSTLRFGQLAIQIDQKNQIQQNQVNLSQQKRDMKKVSNIFEVNAKTNQSYQQLKQKWEIFGLNIFQKTTKCYKIQKQDAKINILLLHAYGYGCDGTDLINFLPYILKSINCNIYSVDFPGFGQSEGQKFSSRSQKFHQKQQPLEFMQQLFKQFNFNQKNKVFLFGYDLGGAIALRCSMQRSLSKSISAVIAFHPTWTDKIQNLRVISIPVQLLWFPIQNFHLVSAGQKMSKAIKKCELYKFNVGAYTQQKASGFYYNYSNQLTQRIIEFIQQNSKHLIAVQNQLKQPKIRGKITEEIIIIDIDKQQQRKNKTRQAIRQYYKAISQKCQDIIFQSIIKGGQNKPKYIKLVSQLPILSPDNINLDALKQLKVFPEISQKLINFSEIPFLTPKKQVHVRANINMSVLRGDAQYLAYDNKNGESGITHKAYISEKLDQEAILSTGKVLVNIQTIKKDYCEIEVDLQELLNLNSSTKFKKNVLGHLVFEDNVSCNYSSNIMKLMLLKSAYLLQNIIPLMNFTLNSPDLLSLQKQATTRIFKTMDLRHLVHQGIDNKRYTGTDVGRLAYYGQGNCHHLASTLAALLLPFGKILGWDVIFRAGSFFITGRDIDQFGQPLSTWNGKPNVNVQDHTWLQIIYKPSNQVFVFDPSFSICNQPLQNIYSFRGKMHISSKLLNFASYGVAPKKLC